MKTFLTLFVAVMCGLGAFSQPVQVPCTAPDSVFALYEFDAKVLAVREMQITPAWQNEIEIPDLLVNRYLRMLVAVYNAVQLPARDTVVKCLNIHTFPEYGLQDILMGVDTNEAWVSNFINGVSPSGNTQADFLIDTYHLSVVQVLPSIQVIVVHAETCINPLALAAKFGIVAGVNYAEPDQTAGAGNDIYAKPTLIEDYELYYKHGWGDCPAGCIANRTWFFSVYALGEPCVVNFVESFGNEVEIPCEPANSSNEENFIDNFEVSPNPANETVRVMVQSSRNSEAELFLVNEAGQTQEQLSLSLYSNVEKIVELDTAKLPAGVYFLALNMYGRVTTKKIIIQR